MVKETKQNKSWQLKKARREERGNGRGGQQSSVIKEKDRANILATYIPTAQTCREGTLP